MVKINFLKYLAYSENAAFTYRHKPFSFHKRFIYMCPKYTYIEKTMIQKSRPMIHKPMHGYSVVRPLNSMVLTLKQHAYAAEMMDRSV